MAFFQRRTHPEHETNTQNGAADRKRNGKRNGAAAIQPGPALDWEFGTDELGDWIAPVRESPVSASHRDRRRVSAALPNIERNSEKPTPVPQPASQPVPPLRSKNDSSQANAVRNALNLALEQWWGHGKLPDPALLRDGLLLLEAGQELGESQRSLLLRTALVLGKGMLTALRHHTDSERTATLLNEALLDPTTALTPATLRRLCDQDAASPAWIPLLVQEIKAELPATRGRQRQLALAGLAELESTPGQSRLGIGGVDAWSIFALATQEERTPARFPLRSLLIGLLMVLLIAFIVWQQLRPTVVQAVEIPAGPYVIRNESDELHTIELDAFAIDRTEVTNQAYRACLAAGQCAQPRVPADAASANVLIDPAFAAFPVVYVDWENANAYCAWVGQRLPTAEEWEVAAGFAPATQRVYRFPWGDQFDPLLANSSATAGHATQPVAQYHPFGNSPFGLTDMAGNVAEWTATASTENTNGYIVKGGSFKDDSTALQIKVRQAVDRQTAEDWLGFRCSKTLPD